MSEPKLDPRSKNIVFSTESISAYLNQYTKTFYESLNKVDQDELNKAFQIVKNVAVAGHTVFVAGNGGSSALADHLCCDFTKGTYTTSNCLKTYSMTSHTALFTALSNDFSYEESFSKQVEMLASKNDAIILISSSGNSPNILAAANEAKKKGMKVIAMTGFAGGKLLEVSDAKLYVPFNNYGVVEDAHQSLIHILAQYLYLTL